MNTALYPKQTLGYFDFQDLKYGVTIPDFHMDGMIFNSACNFWGCLGDCGIEVKISKSDYAKAKQSCLELNPSPCYEEVYMQCLLDGGKWKIWDNENEELLCEMTLQEMRDNLQQKLDRQVYFAFLEGDDDALTANSVLQIAFFGEEVYG